MAERAVRGVKEGTSAVLSQSGLGNEWWADSMECYFYLRNIQDLLADGKTPMKDDLENHFKGPVTPLSAMVEYHPTSAKDQSRNIPRICLDRWVNFGKEIMVADIEGAGHCGRVGNPCSKGSMQKKKWRSKKKKGSTFVCLMAEGTAKLFWKRLWSPRIQSKAGTTCKE